MHLVHLLIFPQSEMSNAGTFYTNRVLKDWKEKSQAHVAWVKAWIQARPETKIWRTFPLILQI
jgi:hypothetical protein